VHLKIDVKDFGALDNGQAVTAYKLGNAQGMSVTVMNLGATITSILTPDKRGQIDDVVLGYAAAQDYLDQHVYMGAIIGRYAGRIAKARFTLDGKDYALNANDGPNNLHGGQIGFDQKIWSAKTRLNDQTASVTFHLISPHLDEGFPGHLDVRVTYSLNNHNQIFLDYEAKADRATHVNLSQHCYFNLEGTNSRNILDHKLIIKAKRYTPLAEANIPSGDIMPVADTPMDFQTGKRIGRHINANHEQIRLGGGYDHNYVLDGNGAIPEFASVLPPHLPPLAAILSAPISGRVMRLYTDKPGLQFYSGNFLHAGLIDRAGRAYAARSGLCLETQYFPDSPNKPQFPSTVIMPGQDYKHRTVYEFGYEDHIS